MICSWERFRLIGYPTILKDSGFFRYLHTAIIVSGTMLVFGGNTHNDTSMSHGAKCFSSDFMAYDIEEE
ncbi:UNVERIFIED_CONTAM: hypothetical protein FKN15_029123 [Acipenser sinensis]